MAELVVVVVVEARRVLVVIFPRHRTCDAGLAMASRRAVGNVTRQHDRPAPPRQRGAATRRPRNKNGTRPVIAATPAEIRGLAGLAALALVLPRPPPRIPPEERSTRPTMAPLTSRLAEACSEMLRRRGSCTSFCLFTGRKYGKLPAFAAVRLARWTPTASGPERHAGRQLEGQDTAYPLGCPCLAYPSLSSQIVSGDLCKAVLLKERRGGAGPGGAEWSAR